MISLGDHEGIEVRVCRGKDDPFPEHKIQHLPGSNTQPPTTTCWLELENGKKFTIETRLHDEILDSYHDGHWMVKTSVDGKVIDASIVTQDDPILRTHEVSKMIYMKDGELSQAHLGFTARLTAINASDATTQVSEELGCITVDVQAGSQGPRIFEPENNSYAVVQTNGGIVQEAQAKVVGSAISAVDPEPARERITCEWLPLEDANMPYHRFVFKYRSQLWLELHNHVKPQIPAEPAVKTAEESRKRKRVEDNAEPNDGLDIQRQILAALVTQNEASARQERRMNRYEKQLREIPQDNDRTKHDVTDLTELPDED